MKPQIFQAIKGGYLIRKRSYFGWSIPIRLTCVNVAPCLAVEALSSSFSRRTSASLSDSAACSSARPTPPSALCNRKLWTLTRFSFHQKCYPELQTIDATELKLKTPINQTLQVTNTDESQWIFWEIRKQIKTKGQGTSFYF